MADRIATEDALKHCHECEYQGRSATAESLAGARGMPLHEAAELMARLVEEGLVHRRGRGLHDLTEAGRVYARRVVRAHRLFETDLARHSGFPETEWHGRAEREEHVLTDEEIERLSERLGHPRWDPHGDPIPTTEGDIPALHGRELTGCPEGWVGRIVHVEDEPHATYERITKLGLVAGMRIKVVAPGPSGCRVNADGRIVELDSAMGAQLRVAELASGEIFDEHLARLSDLAGGGTARVVGLGPGCRGDERNRLLDLGVVPGTDVEIDLVSPSGNPIAYRIRGASIALRREQADHVYVHIVEAMA